MGYYWDVTSGKDTTSYWKASFLIGKSTNQLAIFNRYIELPDGRKPPRNFTVFLVSKGLVWDHRKFMESGV